MGNEHFPQDSLMFIVHCSMITWANTTLAGGRGFYLRPRFSGYWSRQRPEGRGFSGRRDSTSGRTFRFPLRSHRSIWIPHTCPICLLVLGLGTLMSLHVLAPTRIVYGVFSAGRWQSKTLRRWADLPACTPGLRTFALAPQERLRPSFTAIEKSGFDDWNGP